MTRVTTHLDPNTLSALTDNELLPGELESVQQHLADCRVCSLQVITALQLKAAVARSGQRFTPSPDTLARLTAHLQQQQPKKSERVYSFRTATWAALAACLVLTISLVAWRQIGHVNTLSAELLDQHLSALSIGASPQVLSTDRHTVKPWFQGKLPFSFNLPDALPPDTTLKGGDLTYLDGQPAALLLFTIHKHEVSIFLTQRSVGPSAAVLPRVRSGFAIHSANTQELHITAVSDVNPHDLDLLLSALVQAQAP